MSLAHLIKYGLTLPPHVAAAKAARMAGRLSGGWLWRAVNSGRSSFVAVDKGRAPFHRLLTDLDFSVLEAAAAKLALLAERGVEHRFDLLGSGLADPAAEAEPMLAAGNRQRATAIRRLIGDGYRPIDWHVDFKSGYRWPADRWGGAIRYGHEPGVDVKVPWELARLQHLPGLALAHGLAEDGVAGFRTADTYHREFRDQVLDFLAANPPEWGVNWLTAMEVAIRAANMILAYELFRSRGVDFDGAFEAEFHAGLIAHGRHIAAHLEWHPEHRANHYLADVVGLVFIGAFLPRTEETDCWLAFGVRQLIAETERQFTDDGANFEASTNYHRLSAEMVAFASAVALGLDDDNRQALAAYDHRKWTRHPTLPPAPVPWTDDAGPFPQWYGARLRRMAEFTMHVTKPNGLVAQVGDTDNGRLFKLSPACDDAGSEIVLDHRALVAAVDGLTGGGDLTAFAGPDFAFEAVLISALAGGARLDGAAASAVGRTVDRPPAAPDHGADRITETVIELPDPDVLDGLEAVAYPDFGIYLWRSARFFLSVRCGAVGQNGRGGHAHNDQLAIELNVDGEDWLADPGSFTYTASPELRDAYRSVRAHAVPRLGDEEPARLDLGPFRLEDRAKARCLGFDATHFHGVHFGYGVPVFRTVRIEAARIVVVDGYGAMGPGEAEPRHRRTVGSAVELLELLGSKIAFSPAYGVRDADDED